MISAMPRGLAIETSGRIGSIALVEGGSAVAVDAFPHGLRHAAEIVSRIDALCRERGWTPGDLEEVYVSAGPGSFTGLRIGVTLAKTLSLATGAKLVGVPSVEVLARNAPPEARRVIVVLDAKRDQIFTARLSRAGGSDDWTYDEDARLDSLAAMLARSPRPVYLIGEGIPFHRKFIGAEDAGIVVTPEELWRADAAHVATIGWAMAHAGRFADADSLTPVYIRRPEAEEVYERREQERNG